MNDGRLATFVSHSTAAIFPSFHHDRSVQENVPVLSRQKRNSSNIDLSAPDLRTRLITLPTYCFSAQPPLSVVPMVGHVPASARYLGGSTSNYIDLDESVRRAGTMLLVEGEMEREGHKRRIQGERDKI